jgi:hypothetical protein
MTYNPMPSDGNTSWGTWLRGAVGGLDSRASALESAGSGSGTSNAWEFRPETYGAVGNGTTDDTAAIQAAIDAAFAYANSSGTYYAEVVFRPRTYLIAGPYQTKYYGNAQIAIPYQTMKSRKVTLVLRGGLEASAFPIWTQTTSARNGAVLRSTGAGGAPDATNGDFAVVGGQSWQRGFGLSGGQALVGPETGDYNVWNNIMLRVDGVSVVVPSPANQMGFQFQALAEVSIGSVSVYSDAAPSGSGAAGYAQSTNVRAIGLAMPSDYNNADNSIQNYACEGFYIGLLLGEHTVASNIRFLYCHTAVAVTNTAHYSIVTYAVIESCTVGIQTDGHADFLMADFEDSSGAGGLFDTQYFVVAGGSAMGTVRYFTMDSNSKMIPPNLLSINQFSGVRVLDGRQAPGYRDDKPAVPASTQFLLNPYYRDAYVTMTGGTVSKVEVWTPGPTATYRTVATATNTNTIVPTGGYIRLTYTVAPTWEWCLTSATL